MPTVTYTGECDCCGVDCDCACPVCNAHDPCVYYEQYQVVISGYVENPFSCPGDCDCTPYNGTFTLTRGTGGSACKWTSAETYSTDFCPDDACAPGAPLWTYTLSSGPGTQATLSPCSLGGGTYISSSSGCEGADVTGGQTGSVGCCGRGSVIFPYTFTVTPIGSPIDCLDPLMALRNTETGAEIDGPPRSRRSKPRGTLKIRVMGKRYEGEWKDGKAVLTKVSGQDEPGTGSDVPEEDAPPCRLVGGVVPGPERRRLGLGYARRWTYCLHEGKPLGDVVCRCRGCGPACRGYEADPERTWDDVA